MSKMQEDVDRFHFLGKQPRPTKIATASDPFLGALRRSLIREESNELCDAWLDFDAIFDQAKKQEALGRVVDGMVDLLYVTFGAAVALGINLDPFWDLVQDNNLSKVDGRFGPIVHREDGKILKPADWKPPAIQELLARILESQNGK